MFLSNIQESGTQTGDFEITGLPFTQEFNSAVGNLMMHSIGTNANNLTVFINTSETIKIIETITGAAWDVLSWADISDGDDIYGQFTYRTTQ